MTRRHHVPTRTCAVCGTKAPKRELDRIVGSVNGLVSVDPTGKMPGRGAYMCRDESCDRLTLSRNRIAYALRTQISDENWTQLVASIGDSGNYRESQVSR